MWYSHAFKTILALHLGKYLNMRKTGAWKTRAVHYAQWGKKCSGTGWMDTWNMKGQKQENILSLWLTQKNCRLRVFPFYFPPLFLSRIIWTLWRFLRKKRKIQNFNSNELLALKAALLSQSLKLAGPWIILPDSQSQSEEKSIQQQLREYCVRVAEREQERNTVVH